MNTVEKYLTMAIAIVGGGSGLWGAYTAYDASKFKQPLDEHEQVAHSFTMQIASAEKRRDSKEALRVRLLYERYEEEWRAVRTIANLVAPIEALAAFSLEPKELAQLRELLVATQGGRGLPISPRTLGAAFIAVGNYESAVQQLKVASARVDDPRALALQSAALGELARSASTEAMKESLKESATSSFRAALESPRAKQVELSGFAKANAELSAILTEKGLDPMSVRTPAPEVAHEPSGKPAF